LLVNNEIIYPDKKIAKKIEEIAFGPQVKPILLTN
jgi:hypothetical protein